MAWSKPYLLLTGILISVYTPEPIRTSWNGAGMIKAMKQTLLLASSAAAMTAMAAPSWADEAAAEGAAGTITVLSPQYHSPIITSATRTDTPVRDVPQSITVITRDLINDQAMRSVADVLRYVPGAQVAQGEGHRDQIVLRGNNSTADFFVDGMRDDVQYYRDLYNVERVEVLKGPNAMIFGRGGGGGVVNRVIKKAGGEPLREVMLQVGSWEQYRGAVDLGGEVSNGIAVRLNGFYEESESYRDYFNLERFGINPTAGFQLSEDTTLHISYEHVEDDRTTDRGVPSQHGRPFRTKRSQFFGNPAASYATTNVDLITAELAHSFSPNLDLRVQALYGDYDKFYQNVFAGSAVNNGSLSLGAYNSGTNRENLFGRADLIWKTATGPIKHVLLFGAEAGRQDTTNMRRNGSIPGGSTVSASNPVSFVTPVWSAPTQDNNGEADIAAVYVQDQIELSEQVQLIGGLRYDRFKLDFVNNLNGQRFDRTDDMWSPRAGLVYKPVEAVSFYASYSISYLPQSGDQFTTLDLTTAALKPEKFENLEIGAKWEVLPQLLLSVAAFRLDRDNTRAPGATPGTTVLTGSQRSKGIEIELNGSIAENWDIIASLALQEAEITSATSSAAAGTDAALVPETSFALWSSYRFTPRFGIGAGVTAQSKRYASITNQVVLPGYARVDAAVFYALTDSVKLQLNIENLLDERYYATAHSDNNIMPGSPTAARLSLTARF